jgi:hypothetical protein
VKGYDAISTSARVAALKNVLFPTLGFPTNPINIVSKEERSLKD